MPLVLLVIAVVLGGLFFLASRKPNTFRIVRSAQIQAPPESVFPLIEDLRRWRQWSPWETVDPSLKRSYSGADKGIGAIYEWKGNDKAGAGRMEIKDLADSARVAIQIDFLKPWEASNSVELTLAPAPSGATEVTWAMTGESPITSRVMGLFLNLDKIVGKDFEKGLANLKSLAEKPGSAAEPSAPRATPSS